MIVFFINSKRLWKHVFYSMILIFFWQIVCIRENKIKAKILITLPDYTNFIKSFEMTLNSKHITEKLKTKDQGYRKTENQNMERRKSSFTKSVGRKY